MDPVSEFSTLIFELLESGYQEADVHDMFLRGYRDAYADYHHEVKND